MIFGVGPYFLLRKEKNITSGKSEAVNLMESSQNLEHELDQLKIHIASLHRVPVCSSILHICSKGCQKTIEMKHILIIIMNLFKITLQSYKINSSR